MRGRVVCVVVIFVLASGAGAYLWQQAAQAQQLNTADIATLYQRIETLSAAIERTNVQLNAKLDKILQNQELIIKELTIVKIRATRK